MKNYRQVLNNFLQPHFEGATPEQVLAAQDKLRSNLKEVSANLQFYFNICFGIVVLLFLGSIVFVLTHLTNTSAVAAAFGVTGLSCAALLKQMLGMIREKTRSDGAFVLASSMPPEDLKGIVTILFQDTP